MKELDVVKLYNEADAKTINGFNKSLNSALNVKTKYNKVVCNLEWLDLMEQIIIYLDNILRNPNRFIVNEEEIVKVELARRITVDSIKHLSRNTNLIQDIDKKTGDVKPSKILNINKDESFDTYENKFIYTLINNMKNFITIKKQKLKTETSLKDLKTLNYNATTQIGSEKVNVSINVNSSKIEISSNNKKEGQSVPERLEKLEMHINDLCNTEVYKSLARMHVALVTSPIKKTNMILKNTNFQEAVKLWNYLQTHIQDVDVDEHDYREITEDNELKSMIDNSSLLCYLTLDSLSKDKTRVLAKEETEKYTNYLIDQIVMLNSETETTKLKEMVGSKIVMYRDKNSANIKEIQDIYSKKIDEYFLKQENYIF